MMERTLPYCAFVVVLAPALLSAGSNERRLLDTMRNREGGDSLTGSLANWTSEIRVVLNWFEELKARVEPGRP